MASHPPPTRRPSAIELAEKLTYGTLVANIYVLNMYMGTGPIALPFGFQTGGVLLSSLFLVFVAITAYITITFIVETIVIANVLLKFRGDIGEPPVFELVPGAKGKRVFRATDPSVWDIEKRVEIGELAEIFFGGIGVKLTYLFMILYTVGTLTIYAVAVPQALQTLLSSSDRILGLDPYYIFLFGFAAIALPFCFGNFQNTKYLQVCVMFFRFLCFVCMIWAATAHIARGKGAKVNLVLDNDVKVQGMPWMLGNAICTFMMHHSIPGLVKPIRPQKSIKSALLVATVLGLIAYLALCLTAVFAFGVNVNGIYNLNFKNFHYEEIAFFLQVYPALLVALYPLICITLRNNLRNLVKMLRASSSKFATLATTEPSRTSRLPSFADDKQDNLGQQLLVGMEMDTSRMAADADADSDLPTVKEQVGYTFVVALPPFAIAAAAHNVQIVRTLTGSFPGLAVMFFIPSALVYLARKVLARRVSQAVNATSDLLSPNFRKDMAAKTEVENPQVSPFRSSAWVFGIVVIAAGCAIYDAVDLIMDA